MYLSDYQKKFIADNYRKLSLRKIAGTLALSRPDVEKFVRELAGALSLANHETRLIPKIKEHWLIIFLFFLTFITYSNSIYYDFVYDDRVMLFADTAYDSQRTPTPASYLKDTAMPALI